MARFIVSPLSDSRMCHVGTNVLTLCVDLVIKGLCRSTLGHFPVLNTVPGANLGESDGIDISGHNHWVHDVEVTNQYAALWID
jgi:hypothetical protein